MPPKTPIERRERQLDLAFAVVPYVALAVSLALALATEQPLTERYAAWTVGLSAVAAVWLTTVRVPHCEQHEHVARSVVFYVGHLALIGALIVINPFFAVFGFTGYLFVRYLPGNGSRVAGMVVNAALMALSEIGGANQLQGRGWIPYIGLFTVNVFIVGAMTKGAMDEDRRAEQRTRTIDQLSEANRQLEQIMEENAGLHAQLVAQAREAGVFDERQRMAGEIHDTLAQGLTGILAQLEAVELADGDEPRRRRHFGLAKELARDSLAEARRSVQALRPQKLEDARLPDAVRTLADEWKQTSGIPVRVEVDGEATPLQPALEVVLFRAAQEALANIAKHAQASRAGMTLTYMHDQVSLDVLDDGKGFDARQVNGDGYGLAAMRQRLRQVGGGLEIESTPGDGTTVSASVPALRGNERPSEP
ncbi:sensor histidine kinase [Actinospica sp.]|uniref:sensor histidine kinase n=1 Tax=Actinospica sp. TaxID=1872142 RepID=UPI002B5278E9|nr:sensor histidine kinase [Actinospica sp.]HWG26914.1 sensor histidine kinase [Actinospica sp.]